jgi:hypothetical protein
MMMYTQNCNGAADDAVTLATAAVDVDDADVASFVASCVLLVVTVTACDTDVDCALANSD